MRKHARQFRSGGPSFASARSSFHAVSSRAPASANVTPPGMAFVSENEPTNAREASKTSRAGASFGNVKRRSAHRDEPVASATTPFASGTRQ